MKKILALALCLLMLVPMIVSCEDDPNVKKGATIEMYLGSNIYNFDPVTAYTDEAATRIFGLIYQGLFELNSKGKVQKALCKDYKVIEDEEHQTYKMHITINETGWSDGRAVSVDDVIFAWKRVLDPEKNYPMASLLFDIQNAKKYNNGDCSPDDVGLFPIDTDEFEIYFEGKINYDLFIENIASPLLTPLREDIVAKAEDGWATNVAIMVGNGPFAVRGFEPGKKLNIQRNTFFYRTSKQAEDKVVKSYKITIDLSKNPSKQLDLFDEKEIFFDSELAVASRADASKVKTVDTQSVHTYYFNTNNELFKNAKVRQALSMALDREALASSIVYADPATGLITNGVFETKAGSSFRKNGGDILQTTADVSGAKKLLSEAGVKGGSFTLMIRDNEVDVALANAAKKSWESLGFKVEIKKTGFEKFTTSNEYEVYSDEFEKLFTAGEFDVAGLDLQMFSTDAFATLAQYAVGYSGNAIDLSLNSENYDPKPSVTGYNSEEYNKLIDEAYGLYNDRAARSAKLHEAETLLLKDLPITPVVVLKTGYKSSSKVKGYKFGYYGQLDFTKVKMSGRSKTVEGK